MAERLNLESIYQNRFSERDRTRKAKVWRVIVQSYLQQWIQPNDTVLDMGCGDGEFLNYVSCRRRIGVDLNSDSPRRLSEGIEFHACDLTALTGVGDGEVDVVFTSNALEHMANKDAVEAAVHEAVRVLRSGGQLIAMGPNIRFVGGAYWDFWDHHVPLSDRSVVEVMTNAGLRVVQTSPRFLPYTTRSSLPQASWLVSLYLKVPLIWRLLGGQFLVRGVKA